MVLGAVAAICGGLLFFMAIYDLSRAIAGCCEANWAEVVVRIVLVISAVQQATLLWWLHAVRIRRQ
jgi:hypothetical protein